MDLEKRVGEILFRVIDEVNQMLPEEGRLEKSLKAALTGSQAAIDSLGLINFILATERMIEQEFGRAVPLTDGSALMKNETITLTLGMIKDYLCEKLAVENSPLK